MGIHFEREVSGIKKRILALGALVEENMHKAFVALERRDVELAKEVIATDVTIDQTEVEIEEDCLKILALHQPVAGDLRFIVAVSKINNDLERIGDLSANVCARTIELSREERITIPTTMLVMAERIEAMLASTLDSLIDVDAETARRVLVDDREVDELFARLVTELKEDIRTRLDLLDPLIVVFTVARYLERMADRMTNICEDIIYMAEGEIVRHQDPSAVDELLEEEMRREHGE
ncbi:MAG: phosphate signaling complex protein PhoU [Actinobacteria bacterium]|nr:phosphate signaling complex protein PhoU [Actinomycetota bacterium]